MMDALLNPAKIRMTAAEYRQLPESDAAALFDGVDE
jgi:hypothetical protein